MVGHIKLDRKILDWEWYKDINVAHLFVYLILKANFKDSKWQGVFVKRGQLITGRLKISADTGLSEMQIRTCLNKLKLTNEITTNVTSKYTIITICKYDTYQSKKDDNNQQEVQEVTNKVTNNQPASNQQVTTIEEELIRINNDNITIPKKNILEKSNLFRQPNVPKFEEVHRVFLQNGGTKEMAEKFFNSNEALNWFKNGSPIINFSNLIPSYVDTWKKNNKNGTKLNGSEKSGTSVQRVKALKDW